MLVAAWFCILGSLTYCRAMAPPVALALDGGNRVTQGEGESHGEVVGVPDKRILKYFLPSAQAWGANEVAYTGQEGAKRGYSDRNFLRFGRSSDVDKRVKNFLRFGRGGHTEDYDEEDMSELASGSPDKRNHNFLRFGRNDRNFLRFGRAGGSGPETVNLEGSPLEFAHGLKVQEPTEEEKAEIEGYLRSARGNNFLRFGRNNNFLRFGRSVDSQTYCDDCDEDETTIEQSSTNSESKDAESKSFKAGGGAGSPSAVSKPSSTETLRAKRAVYHDYAKLTSRGPASWATRAFPKPGKDNASNDKDDNDDDDDNQGHRSYHTGLKPELSYGRFKPRPTSANSGNNSSSSSADVPQKKPAQAAAMAKAHNAIRFG